MGPGWYGTDWAVLAENDMAMPPYGKAGLFDKEVIFRSSHVAGTIHWIRRFRLTESPRLL